MPQIKSHQKPILNYKKLDSNSLPEAIKNGCTVYAICKKNQITKLRYYIGSLFVINGIAYIRIKGGFGAVTGGKVLFLANRFPEQGDALIFQPGDTFLRKYAGCKHNR